MKKTVVLLAVALFVLNIFGCGNNDFLEKVWSEQEIISMFTSAKDENWEVIDCVVISDNAYDRVGAVLFWDNEKESVNVAFLDADGHYQHSGTFAIIPTEPEFTYLGNGKVTYKLEADDGMVYNYTLTISIDDGDVLFKAEDDLQKQ